jgi:hypothetical protein
MPEARTDRMLILKHLTRDFFHRALRRPCLPGAATRFLREAPNVLILSAEHGLLAHDVPMAAHDTEMPRFRLTEAPAQLPGQLWIDLIVPTVIWVVLIVTPGDAGFWIGAVIGGVWGLLRAVNSNERLTTPRTQ